MVSIVKNYLNQTRKAKATHAEEQSLKYETLTREEIVKKFELFKNPFCQGR